MNYSSLEFKDLNLIKKIVEKIYDNISIINYECQKDSYNKTLIYYSKLMIIICNAKNLGCRSYDWDNLLCQLLLKTKECLYRCEDINTISLSQGYCNIAFAINYVDKHIGVGEKMVLKLNEVIIKKTEQSIGNSMVGKYRGYGDYCNIENGLSGTLIYLLNFKSDKNIQWKIEEIIKYLISITEIRNFYGFEIPGWYIHNDTIKLKNEKETYPYGYFENSFNHGIAGILAAISLAWIEGFKLKNQKEAIEKIVQFLLENSYKNSLSLISWPKKLSLENYLNNISTLSNNRSFYNKVDMGILNSLYLAGKATKNQEILDRSIKSVEFFKKLTIKQLKSSKCALTSEYTSLISIAKKLNEDGYNLSSDYLINISLLKLIAKIERQKSLIDEDLDVLLAITSNLSDTLYLVLEAMRVE